MNVPRLAFSRLGLFSRLGGGLALVVPRALAPLVARPRARPALLVPPLVSARGTPRPGTISDEGKTNI